MMRPQDRLANVTDFPAGPYRPENLLLYHTSLSLVERMVHNGLLRASDYEKAVMILSEKYGFPRDSIFAETA